MVDKFDELQRSLDVLLITTMMIDAGCWASNDIRWPLDGEEFYDVVITALGDCCDFVYFGCNEKEETYSMYFSDSCMLDYYKLCREFSSRRGQKLRDNPYMKTLSDEQAPVHERRIV